MNQHTQKTQIAPWAIAKIKATRRVLIALQDHHEKSEKTIQLWLKNNNPLLTTTDCIQLLCVWLQCERDELLEVVETPLDKSSRQKGEFHASHTTP